MGEAYRARDTRLERIVAVKILPDHLSDRAELRERFDREARTIASLNHAHICTLYDIGQQNGTDFLVMEYLEGETLAERLKKGPLPLEQVLQYAIEISDALDKAHRKGITHRDLKPSNIILTKSGCKLLDFGLAKLRRDAAPSAPLSQVPTKEAMTAEGTILGTLQYMAPEQLEGKEADARTDIFAFGTVVYGRAEAQKVLDQLNEISKHKYVPALQLVVVYTGLGEKDKAFQWLEKAYEARSMGMIKNPTLDPLRSDRRFADLLRRMNLQP